MGFLRQIATLATGLFVFFAIVAALSKLLVNKDLPSYIEATTKSLANLFSGAFGVTDTRVVGSRTRRASDVLDNSILR